MKLVVLETCDYTAVRTKLKRALMLPIYTLSSVDYASPNWEDLGSKACVLDGIRVMERSIPGGCLYSIQQL